ncbi:neprilysin-3-like [Leptopilina heterotoma]|uniref:neprilysin-3-like n=1 Tax=Leptopilina heterotoma TaxID=63436 RepID=UPI001CA834F6|nr:neprilysin-3-like [Leptopilina heterotoma]
MQVFLLPILSIFTVVYCQEMDLDQLSNLLYSGMDYTVDPCDNFYDFVCGKWVRNNPRVRYINYWDISAMNKVNLIHRIRDILERNDISRDNTKLYMEKKYYDSCIDNDYSVVYGKEIFANIMSQTNWEGKTWQDVDEYYAKKIGEVFLFHVVLDKEMRLNILKPHKLRTNLVPYDDRQFPSNNINYFLKHHGKITEETLNEHNQSLLEFVRNINELVHNEESETDMYFYTVEKLQEFYDTNCSSLNDNSKINWHRILQLLAERTENFIEPSFKITIDANYILQLCRILSNTPPSTIVLYMQFNFEFTPEIYYSLNTVEGVNSSPESRSYYCINNIPVTLGFSDVIMNNQEFAGRKKFVRKIINHLKPILREKIGNSWIDQDANNDALNRISEIKLLVLALNYVLSEFMSEKTVVSYKFRMGTIAFQNLINFKKAQTVYKFQLALGEQKKSKNNRRSKRAMELHAFLDEEANLFMMSPALLFAPFYHQRAPTAYNFGRMGGLVGHEMSHSFDINYLSVKYESSWETENPDMAILFNERKTCLINHYNNLNAEGTKTLNENYADIQGLKLAFQAMRQMIDANESLGLETLPGFERFNADQLFFISFANHYCELPVINNDEDHAPFVIRTIGTLQNMREFSEAFNCRIGQPMNPINKCDFWEVENP